MSHLPSRRESNHPLRWGSRRDGRCHHGRQKQAGRHVYRDQRRYSEAEAFYERALAIRAKSLQSDHPDLVELQEDYATLLRATGREQEAKDLETRVRDAQGESGEGEE